MLPDRVSNPGPLTYESGALPIALRGPAEEIRMKFFVSYDLAVFQWIKLRNENRILTLWCIHITSLTMSVPTMHFLFEIMFILKAINSHFLRVI